MLTLIELFNAFNALSDHLSLFSVGIFGNLYLLAANFSSLLLHLAVLYIPIGHTVFGTASLSLTDWVLVFLFSAPIILIVEILKYYERNYMEAKQMPKKKID